MKLIFWVFLFIFDTALGGKCLPDDIIDPCTCKGVSKINLFYNI